MGKEPAAYGYLVGPQGQSPQYRPLTCRSGRLLSSCECYLLQVPVPQYAPLRNFANRYGIDGSSANAQRCSDAAAATSDIWRLRQRSRQRRRQLQFIELRLSARAHRRPVDASCPTKDDIATRQAGAESRIAPSQARRCALEFPCCCEFATQSDVATP